MLVVVINYSVCSITIKSYAVSISYISLILVTVKALEYFAYVGNH